MPAQITPFGKQMFKRSLPNPSTFVLMHWVVEKVVELAVMAVTAVVQKRNREIASCWVAHMVYDREIH